jgi:hypothetical protein
MRQAHQSEFAGGAHDNQVPLDVVEQAHALGI